MGSFRYTLFLCIVTITTDFIWTGVRGQFNIRTAFSDPAKGYSTISCNPASRLLIRTAQYLASPNETSSLTTEDVLTVYRYCHKQSSLCDLSEAGVQREFQITYYCLDDTLLDPCSENVVEGASQKRVSLLINYTIYSDAREVSCQCSVTSTSNNTFSFRALNLFDQGVYSSEHTPQILIRNDKFPSWVVAREALPVEWQLLPEGNMSLSLFFEQIQGIKFGLIWINLEGQVTQLHCNHTWQRRSAVNDTDEPEDRPKSIAKPSLEMSNGVQEKTVLYITGAVSMAIITMTVVVIVVAKFKGKRRRLTRKEKQLRGSTGKPDLDKIHVISKGGDYCTIKDSKSTRASHDENLNRSPREIAPPAYAETAAATSKPLTFDNSSLPGLVNPAFCSDMRAVDHGDLPPRSREPSRFMPRTSDYGTLCHRPVPTGILLRPSEPAIYDHAGNFRSAGGESPYGQLQYFTKKQHRVIDNDYDTTSSV